MQRFLIGKLIVAGVTMSAIGIAAAEDLTRGQVKTRIEAAGYTNVKNIRKEGDHFDARATSRSGQEVALDVDAKTGAIALETEGKGERHERRGTSTK
jgi:hypothetical protein